MRSHDNPKIAFVAGARPNFMKIAPVLRAVDELAPPFEPVIVHTGQHYSAELSDIFFEQLGIRAPDVHLDAGSGTHGRQTAKVLEAFECFLLNAPSPVAAVVVVGDVNSTVAAALAATKLQIPAIHLEAGLRSFDRTMPEEINRLATDAISDLLLVSEPAGEENLRNEGVPASRIRYVGNVMIDTLVHHLPQAQTCDMEFAARPFALVTLHRPSNVDQCGSLSAIVTFLLDVARDLPVAFPVHPRTRNRLQEFALLHRLEENPDIHLLPPLGYVENLALMRRATLVMTDSGGIQEETSYLSIPCLTLRENTERPATLRLGTNTLTGSDYGKARRLVCEILSGQYRRGNPIPGWDGRAAPRVVSEISRFLEDRNLVSPASQSVR
jgi:UDP-N-acetylglucosamine 2-epimerase (non-hydrolysing)